MSVHPVPATQPALPGRRTLVLQIGLAIVVATVLAVVFVFPAEYRIDVTGFGELTGLDNISAPSERVVQTRSDAPLEISRTYDLPVNSNTVTIPLGGITENRGEVEYKVTMQAGTTLVYSWKASGPVYYEFHGHTLSGDNGAPIQVMNYRQDKAAEASGSLVAPIDGIHGWYFRNDGFEPITIELTLDGFYELKPGRLDLTNPLLGAAPR